MNSSNQSRQTTVVVLGSLIVILGLSSLILFFQNRLLRQQSAGIPNTQSPSPSPTGSPDPTADWKTYIDTNKKYEFKYPSSYNLTTFSTRPLLNRKITWYEISRVPNQQCGDCPVQSTSETFEFPFGIVTKITGYSGEIGGGIPQSYVSYEIRETNNKIIVFELWELPQDLTPEEIKLYPSDRKEGQIPKEDVKIFDQIIATFNFLEIGSSKPTLISPISDSIVSSPLMVSGTAPSGWMFEGQLTIKLLDSQKKLIAQTAGKEKVPGSWQSGKTADFTGTLTFSTSDTTGFLVIEADNPSGLPENAKSYEIPVKFK